jgi:hypothetical protein
MGVELSITRTPFGAEDQIPISAEEWLALVDSDPELRLWPEQGPYFVRWLGESAYPEPWLDWSNGVVSSKWPDTALYLKMLRIATQLGARVSDDDDTTYESESDWEFDPNAQQPVAPKPRGFWKRIFGGGV